MSKFIIDSTIICLYLAVYSHILLDEDVPWTGSEFDVVDFVADCAVFVVLVLAAIHFGH